MGSGPALFRLARFYCIIIVLSAKRDYFFVYLYCPHSNKQSDPEKYALKLKLHHHGVASCTFSSDESKVLSCAGNEVKVRQITPSCTIMTIETYSYGMPRPVWYWLTTKATPTM